MAEKMKAILIKNGKGPVENLYIGETERPKPTLNGQVLVKVNMFGINRMDLHQREGNYPVPPGTTSIMGVEFSGTVAEVASDATDYKVGDEVFGLAYGGAYAQYILCLSVMLAHKPAHLSWAEAAGIPEVWLTAFKALFVVGKFMDGESILIHAGASGVGIAAIQMARMHGAKNVFATAGSVEKLDFLKKMPLPPTETINYRTEDFSKRVAEVTGGHGVDFVIDFIGKDYWHKNIDSLAKDGRMVHLAMLTGADIPDFSLRPVLMKRLSIIGSTLRARTPDFQAELTRRFKDEVLGEIRGEDAKEDDGQLRAYTYRVYPWTEIQAAHIEMANNRNVGKIIMEVTE